MSAAQLDLFSDPQAGYRRTDPRTSRCGAVATEASGSAAKWRERVYRAVQLHPHRTAGELADLMGVTRESVHKRLPELRKKGLIRNGPERECEVSGVECKTWEAV